jgi:hypothetical protein
MIPLVVHTGIFSSPFFGRRYSEFNLQADSLLDFGTVALRTPGTFDSSRYRSSRM